MVSDSPPFLSKMHIWHCSNTAFPQSDPINFICVENWRAPQTYIYEDCYICMCNILHYLFVSTEFWQKTRESHSLSSSTPLYLFGKAPQRIWLKLNRVLYVRQVKCVLFFRILTGVYRKFFEHVKIQRDFYLHLGNGIWI